jgi:hypothetical protein
MENKRLKVKYLTGSFKGQVKEVRERLALSLKGMGYVEIVSDDAKINISKEEKIGTETKELKQVGQTKKVPGRPKTNV